MAFRLDWRGSEVQKRVDEAAKNGIDETTAATDNLAKQKVPVRTGMLRSGIRFEPAKKRGKMWIGYVGVWDINYAIYVELGTSRQRAQPYLRPSADIEFPKLKDRIRKNYGT